MNPKELALFIANYVRENRAKDVVVLEISRLSSIADYFVICTGLTNRHSQAILHDLEEELRKRKIRPQGAEGHEIGRWAILDYDDVILHIFLEDARNFYDLEELWSDAKQIQLPPEISQQPTSSRVSSMLGDLFPNPTPIATNPIEQVPVSQTSPSPTIEHEI